jgi:hypothetical protein
MNMKTIFSLLFLLAAQLNFSYSVAFGELLGMKQYKTTSVTPKSDHEPDFEKDPKCQGMIGLIELRVFVPKNANVSLDCQAWIDSSKNSMVIADPNAPLNLVEIFMLTDERQKFSSRSFQRQLKRFRLGIYLISELSVAQHIDFVEHELYHAKSLTRYAKVDFKVPRNDRLFVALEEVRAHLATLCADRSAPQSAIAPQSITESIESHDDLLAIIDSWRKMEIESGVFYRRSQFIIEELGQQLTPKQTQKMCVSLLDFQTADREIKYQGRDARLRSLHLVP